MLYDYKNPLMTAAATLRGSSEAARTANIDLRPILAKFGWSSRWLEAPTGYIAYHAAVEFLNEVARVHQFSAFGFEIGRHQSTESYGPVLQTLKLCATHRDAFEMALKHHLLVSEVALWTMTSDARYAVFERIERVQYPGDQQQLQELALTAFYAMTNQVATKQLLLREVHFTSKRPSHSRQMQAFFGCPVEFERESNALIYPTHVLDMPLPSADATILAAVSSYLASLGSERPLNDSLTDRVYRYIKQSLGSDECNLEATAQRFGYSPRGLQRELSKHGDSFRDLLNQARLHAAEHYLKRTDMKISDLAGMLGYRNVTAFSRAFRKSAGLSPDLWRRRGSG